MLAYHSAIAKPCRKMPHHTFSTGSEAIAVYGEPRLARRNTLITIREVEGNREELPYGDQVLIAIKDVDYVATPIKGGFSYVIKKDIFTKSWQETSQQGVYEKKVICKVIPIPEGDMVVLNTLEGQIIASYPDYIAIGVDDEVYPNRNDWVKDNLIFL